MDHPHIIDTTEYSSPVPYPVESEMSQETYQLEEINPNKSADWMRQAKCSLENIGPKIFYPHGDEGIIAAKRICGECVVKAMCLEYAITKPEPLGVWGGKSENERRSLRKKQSIQQSFQET